MSRTPPPRAVHEHDQIVAEVRDLARKVRRHWPGCDFPGHCAGDEAIRHATESEHPERLLLAALVLLAQAPEDHLGPNCPSL